jgi:hypothetical protein
MYWAKKNGNKLSDKDWHRKAMEDPSEMLLMVGWAIGL